MINRLFGGLGLGALLAAAVALPALADGSLKDDAAPAAAEARDFKFSWNLGVTNDYIFRGYSQDKRRPSVEGGIDITYGTYYFGLWAANVDFNPATDPFLNQPYNGRAELDVYTGFKPVLKRPDGDLNFDFGVIGYLYPGADSPNANLNYWELKAGVNRDIWKNGNLASTLYFSPNYQLDTGRALTMESTFTQTFEAQRGWVPAFSATLGHQWGDSQAYRIAYGNGELGYYYWNAGMTFTRDSKLSVDVRYWGTDLKNNNAASGFADNYCNGKSLQCGNRFQGTVKYTY